MRSRTKSRPSGNRLPWLSSRNWLSASTPAFLNGNRKPNRQRARRPNRLPSNRTSPSSTLPLGELRLLKRDHLQLPWLPRFRLPQQRHRTSLLSLQTEQSPWKSERTGSGRSRRPRNNAEDYSSCVITARPTGIQWTTVQFVPLVAIPNAPTSTTRLSSFMAFELQPPSSNSEKGTTRE